MKEIFAEKMKNNPIIAGVKDEKNLEDALNSDCEIIFLLCGSIFNLKDIVKQVRDKNKMIFIHNYGSSISLRITVPHRYTSVPSL